MTAAGAAILAGGLAGGGLLAVRRRADWMPVVVALAILGGWSVVAVVGPGGRFGGWSDIAGGRRDVGAMVVPAFGFVVAGVLATRWRTRWVAFAVVAFAAWWLAGSGVGRAEFWRVLVGGLVVGWVLRRGKAGEGQRALAVAGTVAGATVLAGASRWGGAGLVLAGAAVAAWRVRGASVPVGLSMTLLVGAVLGAGESLRGGVGVVDAACGLGLGVPWAVPAAQARLRRLGRRGAAVAAPIVVAAGAVALGWFIARAWQEFHVTPM